MNTIFSEVAVKFTLKINIKYTHWSLFFQEKRRSGSDTAQKDT